jgi:hypothetical protein
MPAIPPPTTTMFSALFAEAMIAVLTIRDMIEVVLYEISTKRGWISLEILIHRVEGMRADVNEHRLYPKLSWVDKRDHYADQTFILRRSDIWHSLPISRLMSRLYRRLLLN